MFYPDTTGHKKMAFANCKSRGSKISVSLFTFTTFFFFLHETPKIKLSNLHYAVGFYAQMSVRLLLFIGASNYRGCLAINTLRTGDADLRFYITTVQDG